MFDRESAGELRGFAVRFGFYHYSPTFFTADIHKCYFYKNIIISLEIIYK